MYYTYFIIGVNSVLCIFGFIMFSMGIYILHGMAHSGTVADAVSTNGSLLVFLGLLLMLNASFGIYTVFIRNLSLIALHAVFLLTIVITHFFTAIYTFVELSSAENTYETHSDNLHDHYKDAYTNNITDTAKILENLQRTLKCCGADGYHDFFKIHDRNDLPASCCKDDKLPCTHPFKMGCIVALVDKTTSDLKMGAWLSIIVTFIPVIGFPVVYKKIKKMMRELRVDVEEDN